ncbi:MAG: glycosyltransferase family 4 protein [Methanomassiliicoccales archaeon]|nr:glycosyltransferase family 4 protein [Methanomassiliicoccales archaeon]
MEYASQEKPTSIVMIGTLPPLKGISPYCLELLKSLSKKIRIDFIGFKSLYPEFLYPGGTKSEERPIENDDPNYRIHNVIKYYNPLSWVRAGLKGNGGVLHAQWWAQPLAPIFMTIFIVSKIRGKRIVITLHNVEPHENSRYSTLITKSILSFGDEFIVHNESNKEVLSQSYHLNGKKIHVIPHGILRANNSKTLSRDEARESLRLGKTDKVLLFFGNIRDYKGLDTLLEAVGILKNEFTNLKLIIAGKPWVQWGVYKEIIESTGISRNIVEKLDFIEIDEVNAIFTAVDLVVLPYKYFEAQSGVGTLALSFNKPIIVTDVGGLPDLVKDEMAIVKPNDPLDLAEKISNILKDERLIMKLKKDTRELAQEYEWESIAEKTVQIYTK